MRLPGPSQGTTVCVQKRVDMEQQSDHKLMTLSGMGPLFCGQGRTPVVSLVCNKGMCQRVVNLNQYAGPSS